MKYLEDRLQAECFQWFWNSFVQLRGLMWAVPNGGARNEKEANKLKATGVVAGVFDLHLFIHGNLHVFELKSPEGKLSSSQKKWGDKISLHGANKYIIKDFKTFKNIILHIINI